MIHHPLSRILFAGVDEVLAGSVIAVSYVDFTKDAPTQAVDAAMEQLHTNGQNQFAESDLPAKWGWLLSYNMGQNKTDMMQDGPGEIQIQSMNFPAAKPAHRSGSKLSLTVTIVIAVGGLAVGALALVCAIVTVRHRRTRRKQQGAKKPAQKQSPQKGGGGGASGYLADLDGMLDDATSDKSKIDRVRAFRPFRSVLQTTLCVSMTDVLSLVQCRRCTGSTGGHQHCGAAAAILFGITQHRIVASSQLRSPGVTSHSVNTTARCYSLQL
jgi:hypothetical protein